MTWESVAKVRTGLGERREEQPHMETERFRLLRHRVPLHRATLQQSFAAGFGASASTVPGHQRGDLRWRTGACGWSSTTPTRKSCSRVSARLAAGVQEQAFAASSSGPGGGDRSSRRSRKIACGPGQRAPPRTYRSISLGPVGEPGAAGIRFSGTRARPSASARRNPTESLAGMRNGAQPGSDPYFEERHPRRQGRRARSPGGNRPGVPRRCPHGLLGDAVQIRLAVPGRSRPA